MNAEIRIIIIYVVFSCVVFSVRVSRERQRNVCNGRIGSDHGGLRVFSGVSLRWHVVDVRATL